MDMIEKVARALCVSQGENPDQPTPAHKTVDFLWQHYRNDARAAIEATRDSLTPDFATTIMFQHCYVDWVRSVTDRDEWYGDYSDFQKGWRIAFDKALGKEGDANG